MTERPVGFVGRCWYDGDDVHWVSWSPLNKALQNAVFGITALACFSCLSCLIISITVNTVIDSGLTAEGEAARAMTEHPVGYVGHCWFDCDDAQWVSWSPHNKAFQNAAFGITALACFSCLSCLIISAMYMSGFILCCVLVVASSVVIIALVLNSETPLFVKPYSNCRTTCNVTSVSSRAVTIATRLGPRTYTLVTWHVRLTPSPGWHVHSAIDSGLTTESAAAYVVIERPVGFVGRCWYDCDDAHWVSWSPLDKAFQNAAFGITALACFSCLSCIVINAT
eukprot:m51a1_g6838 hypothetical protein (282) ;mRNA; r:63596-67113